MGEVESSADDMNESSVVHCSSDGAGHPAGRPSQLLEGEISYALGCRKWTRKRKKKKQRATSDKRRKQRARRISDKEVCSQQPSAVKGETTSQGGDLEDVIPISTPGGADKATRKRSSCFVTPETGSKKRYNMRPRKLALTAALLKHDGVSSSEIKKYLSSHVARRENSYNEVQEVLVPPQNSDMTDPIESCSDEQGEDPSIRRALQTVAMTSVLRVCCAVLIQHGMVARATLLLIHFTLSEISLCVLL